MVRKDSWTIKSIDRHYEFLGYLQLTDFGMARKLKTKEDLVFTFCGTPEYLSPEMLMHKGQGSPDDSLFRPL